jgi:hypothetical protein
MKPGSLVERKGFILLTIEIEPMGFVLLVSKTPSSEVKGHVVSKQMSQDHRDGLPCRLHLIHREKEFCVC